MTNHEDQELVALFHGLDTPGVSDAMDKLGSPGQCLGIVPLDNYIGVIVGPAFTVKYVSASTPAGTVGDFIEDVAEGDVVVIAGKGHETSQVFETHSEPFDDRLVARQILRELGYKGGTGAWTTTKSRQPAGAERA